jgi:putative tryptophan/tyrosine transport system substrate-binding protein
VKRRTFVVAALAAPALPPAVRAQTAGRRPRIAYLSLFSAQTDPRLIEGFKRGLEENGLVDGHTVDVEYDWAAGSPQKLAEMSAALVHSDTAVVVTEGPRTTKALLDAGFKKPIVLAISSDPVGSGFAVSLARPGGSITGLSMSNVELEGKRLALLKEVVPSLKHAFMLRDPSTSPQAIVTARDTARSLGVELLLVETRDPAGFEAAFADAVAKGADGVSVMTSPLFFSFRAKLIELAMRHRLPSIWEMSNIVRDGGLMSYGPDFTDMYRRSAGYVGRILKGILPADMPIEEPTKFELVINQKTAQALGITFSRTLLAGADEVIE